MIEHPQTAVPQRLVAFESKVDLFDSKPLRVDAELGFRALSAPAEQDAIFLDHVWSFRQPFRGSRHSFDSPAVLLKTWNVSRRDEFLKKPHIWSNGSV